ncbi:PREDICTED: uncharacterized protein LOC105149684 isoform X2 [Acromyrmex echinatior]|uniref:uncharacterized protein LOC105149684 isoform X2 n=1 Tax=Acromyrmex echinatior TaxID=103372 RepID=UPI000580E2D5|nr:PREDICTED: uncharacterized protein LOC105149684 isoform X2 [Acromyrmex echinatior]
MMEIGRSRKDFAIANCLNFEFITYREWENYLNTPSEQRETGETSNVHSKNDTIQYASRNMKDVILYLKRKGIHDIIDSLLGELLGHNKTSETSKSLLELTNGGKKS